MTEDDRSFIFGSGILVGIVIACIFFVIVMRVIK